MSSPQTPCSGASGGGTGSWASPLAALCAVLLSTLAGAEPLVPGKVVAITDGDTLVLLDDANRQHKIRLAGIDAPEKGQPFGHASKQSLADLAFGRLVVADCPKIDRYGRQVCVVWADDQDLNLAQVRLGLAWHYKQYEREQSDVDRQAYAEAEEESRRAQRGLWKDASPVPPWDWRHAPASRGPAVQ